MRLRWMAVCGLGLAVVAAVTMGAAPDKTMKYSFKLMGSKGDDAGKVTFSQKSTGPVKMHVELKNVGFGDHAVHIHQNAVCDAPDFKGAGGHFNPDKKQHGWDNPMGHHNGDLPKNVSVGEDHNGEATFELTSIFFFIDSPPQNGGRHRKILPQHGYRPAPCGQPWQHRSANWVIQ